MYTNNKRIFRLLIISVLMNLILFSAAYFLKLPLWLDTTGTIYVSCILGSPAGFLVAIINNVTQAIFFYGDQSLLFYFVSLLTAYVAGTVMEKYRTTKVKKWIWMTVDLLLLEGLSAVLITFIANQGIPSNYWSNSLYGSFVDAGMHSILATVYSVLAIKIPDVIVSIVIVIFAISVTPKKLRDTDVVIMKSLEEIK